MMMLPRLLCALASGFLAVSNGAVLVEKYGLHNDMILQADASPAVATAYPPLYDIHGYVRCCDYPMDGVALNTYDIGLYTPAYQLYTPSDGISIVNGFWVDNGQVTSVKVSIYDASVADISYLPISTANIPFAIFNDYSDNELLVFYGLVAPSTTAYIDALNGYSPYHGVTRIEFDRTSLPAGTFDSSGYGYRSRDYLDYVQQWWTSVYNTNAVEIAQATVANAMADDSYEVGYRAGSADGYRNGYAVGYDDGVADSTTTEHGIIALFSAVANVPIQVLNGLGGLAVWHTPIVGIIISFLFIAVVAGIIKRFI